MLKRLFAYSSCWTFRYYSLFFFLMVTFQSFFCASFLFCLLFLLWLFYFFLLLQLASFFFSFSCYLMILKISSFFTSSSTSSFWITFYCKSFIFLLVYHLFLGFFSKLFVSWTTSFFMGLIFTFLLFCCLFSFECCLLILNLLCVLWSMRNYS